MPESSRDEIAKLEALYANNPEGRVFTHLAEAYRKAGDLARARTILEDGLAKHAGYASAHVVLGRVLVGLQQPVEAEATFRRVLELDPHNLIALRSLGDLSRADGRRDEAIGYFEELRQQDPSNEDIAEIITELRTAPPPEAPPSEPAPVPPAEPEPVPVPESEPAPPAPPEMPDLAAGSFDLDWVPANASEDLPGDLGALTGLSAPQEAEAPDLPTFSMPEDLGAFGDLGDLGTLDATEPQQEDALDTADFGLLSLDEPAADSPAESAAIDPPAGGAPAFEMPALETPAAEAPAAPAAEALAETPAVEMPAAESPVAETPVTEAGDVVTETIAELYTSQGLHDRAADVYRTLLRQRPGDAQLEAKLAEAEAALRPALEPIVPEEAEFILDEPFEAQVQAGQAEAGIEPAPPMADAARAEPEAPDSQFPPEPDLPQAPEFEPAAWGQQPDQVPEPWAAGPFTPPEDEVVEPDPAEAWLAGGAQAAPDAPTPYAWTEDGSESENGDGPTIGEYFRQLLAFRPAQAGHAPAQPEPFAGEPAAEENTFVEPPAAEDEHDELMLLLDEPVADEAENSLSGPVETDAPPPALTAATQVAPDPMPWDEPGPPAEPPPFQAEPPAADAGSTAATSEEAFDQWFGADAPAAPAAAQPNAEAQPTAQAEEQGGEDDDDLEMFRSWLQSLKK